MYLFTSVFITIDLLILEVRNRTIEYDGQYYDDMHGKRVCTNVKLVLPS